MRPTRKKSKQNLLTILLYIIFSVMLQIVFLELYFFPRKLKSKSTTNIFATRIFLNFFSNNEPENLKTILQGKTPVQEIDPKEIDSPNRIEIEKELNFPPIDIVYTYVNGSDINWIQQKNKKHLDFLSEVLNVEKENLTDDEIFEDSIADNGDNRYRSRDELRYSLRSILLYAPWANNIFIVVANDKTQVPEWLDISHERIHIVTHEDIFDNKEYLPTFNTNAIESQLDNIPGLSDYYLYFNDDMFLGNDVTPYDFLMSKLTGLQIRYDEGWPPRRECNPGCAHKMPNDGTCQKLCNVASCGFDFGDCGVEEMEKNKAKIKAELRSNKKFESGKAGFWDLAKYVDGVYNRGLRVNREPRNLIMHTPYFINKKLMKDLKERFYDEFDWTASHKFRHPEDMQLSFSYFHYIASVRVFAPSNFQAWYAAFNSIKNPGDIFLYKKIPEEWDEVELQRYHNISNSTDYQILKNCTKILASDKCISSTMEECISYLKSNKLTATYCQNTMNKVLPKLRLPIYYDVRGKKDNVEFKIIEGDDDYDFEQLQRVYFNRKKFVTINDDMPDEGVLKVEERIACMYKAFLPNRSPFEKKSYNESITCNDLEGFKRKRTPRRTRGRRTVRQVGYNALGQRVAFPANHRVIDNTWGQLVAIPANHRLVDYGFTERQILPVITANYYNNMQ